MGKTTTDVDDIRFVAETDELFEDGEEPVSKLGDSVGNLVLNGVEISFDDI